MNLTIRREHWAAVVSAPPHSSNWYEVWGSIIIHTYLSPFWLKVLVSGSAHLQGGGSEVFLPSMWHTLGVAYAFWTAFPLAAALPTLALSITLVIIGYCGRVCCFRQPPHQKVSSRSQYLTLPSGLVIRVDGVNGAGSK